MLQLSREEALALARRSLPLFGINGGADLAFVKQRENVVFRVSEAGGSYALRIHRHGHRSDAEIRTENAYIAALGSAGLAVPEVVPALDGELFVLLTDDSGREHQIDAQRWVDHSVPLGDAGAAWAGDGNIEPNVFEVLGELCGRFHMVSRETGCTPDYSRRSWDCDGLVGDAPLWGDPRRLATTQEERSAIEAAMDGIRKRLAALGTDPDVYGVIHADFTPENILVVGEDLTLIDFDDFGQGWWLFDIATVLFWYHRHPRAAEYETALLAGYERHVSIPERAREALDALILARGLTYLGWAADRPDDETSDFLRLELLPGVLGLCRTFNHGEESADQPGDKPLLVRRAETLGPHSPLFYDSPLHFVSGDGVWLVDARGERYLDAYNNVPQVGHANRRVADAVCTQSHTLNVHTRYLSEPIVDYAEALLSTFDRPLDRVYFTNSGSESNELALRIARHRTGRSGIIVSDHSYHGNTIALAAATTGLPVSEPFGDHVRTIHIPDLDGPEAQNQSPERLLAAGLAEIDAAIASLVESGHDIAALLIEPAFSTEGLPRVPEGYVAGLIQRVQAAGGLIIADEVQAGLGRLGDVWWGHQAVAIKPDLVTLGKPLGNGYPLGGVVTTEEILEDFSSANLYFNTFAGTPVAAAAGLAVLEEVTSRNLVSRTGDLGRRVAERLRKLVVDHPAVAAAKGRGLFFGLALVDESGRPDSSLAKRVVEALVSQRILISRIGPQENVLKIRPPLVISQEELDRVIDALDTALSVESDRRFAGPQ